MPRTSQDFFVGDESTAPELQFYRTIVAGRFPVFNLEDVEVVSKLQQSFSTSAFERTHFNPFFDGNVHHWYRYGTEKIKVTSTLSKMVAEIEYEIVVPFNREMTDEEKQDWIDRYLERPEVVEKIYQKDNFTTFSWDDEQLDWEPVSPTKEVTS